MEKYDGHTRSFENVALKAGEEYDGEYKLVTLDSKYVSITIACCFHVLNITLIIITSCFFCNRKNLKTLSNKTAIVIYQLIILNLDHLSLEYAVNTNVIKPIQKHRLLLLNELGG